VGVGALIESLRGGQSAGDALAALIFGHFSPSGRMPCAVVGTATGLRPYAEMDFTKGRGCRYAHVSALPPPPYFCIYLGMGSVSLHGATPSSPSPRTRYAPVTDWALK
jgi:hypothetical protein